MARATAAAAALSHIVASDYCLPSDELQTMVAAWCCKEKHAARRIAAQFDDAAWGRGLEEYVRQQTSMMAALAPGAVKSTPVSTARTAEERPVAALWEGPINIRAMLGDAPAPAREAAAGLLRLDSRNYALLFNMAIRADGSRSRDTIVREASFALRRPIDPDTAACFLDVLIQSGWAREAAGHVSS